MAKRKAKSSTYRKLLSGKIKNPQRPRWMRVLFLTTMVLASIFAFLVFAEALIRYYRLVTK